MEHQEFPNEFSSVISPSGEPLDLHLMASHSSDDNEQVSVYNHYVLELTKTQESQYRVVSGLCIHCKKPVISYLGIPVTSELQNIEV